MLYILFFALFMPAPLSSVSPVKIKLSTAQLKEIGNKIWKNECAGRQEGLTFWKKGEDFASLGIGHWIWFHKKRPDCFVEGFPLLIAFYRKQKIAIPSWLLTHEKRLIACPWNSREEFLADYDGQRMRELRTFLYETVDIQALCMLERLKDWTRNKRLHEYDHKRRTALIQKCNKLMKTPQGIYALIDYINFKGEGFETKENSQGKGWGLVQVLEAMPAQTTTTILNDFAAAAQQVLAERVKNSPPERNEAQWLPGWYNRIATYTSSF